MFKFIFYLPIITFFTFSCQKKVVQYNKSTAIYKNYKFYNNLKFDSVFFSLFIDSEGTDPKSKYIDENIVRIKSNMDKDIISHFLYSLTIYNAIYRKFKSDSIILKREHFFKNTSFKSRYISKNNDETIVLENFDKQLFYDFAGQLSINYINDKVEIFIPVTECKLTCSTNFFHKELYDMKLGNLIKKP
ncbi:MAG: hypothetical protein IPM26_03165 [Saprospiraceae bacterium]|nr:hypothetical protein [Saprospiraceae bacterium]